MTLPDTIHNNHRPDADMLNKIDEIREGVKALHRLIAELTPYSREQTLSLQNLELVCYWGVKSIVLQGEPMDIGDRYQDTRIIKANDSTGDSN